MSKAPKKVKKGEKTCLEPVGGRRARAMERRGKDWKAMFLRTLAATGNITGSARAAGVDRETAYEHKRNDEAFAAAWVSALESCIDDLEESGIHRAKDGMERMRFGKNGAHIDPRTGKPYVEFEYSDTLWLAIMKAHRPQLYRERLEVENTTTVQLLTPIEQRERLAAILPTLNYAAPRLLDSGGVTLPGDASEGP